MKYKLTAIVNLAFLFFCSCSKIDNNTKSHNLSMKLVDSLVDIKIPLTHLQQNVNSEHDESLICFYPNNRIAYRYSDDFTNIMDTFQFTSDLIHGEIDAIYKVSKNTFWAITYDTLYEFCNDTIKDKILITQNDPVYLGHFSGFHNIPFYVYKNKAYLHRLNISCENEFNDECWNESIIQTIDIKSKNKNNLPISYPEKFQKHKFPSSMMIVNMVPNDSLLIFNFVVDERLYIYNINTKKIKSYICKSPHQSKDIEGIDTSLQIEERSQEVLDYYTTTSKYSILTHDRYNQLYYRIFFKGQELLNKDSLFNTYLDRKTYLTIINDKFSVLGDLEIDTKKYNYGIIPMKKGIAIPRRKLVNGKYRYDIFKINL